jgi:protoporphyrinogen oxidase
MVVNLFFPSPTVLPAHGFGYLIPSSIPFSQNPERALGVVFDTDSAPGQDSAPGTKVTVMLGGHWWDGWTAFPSEEEGLLIARSLLERHLKITERPVAWNVALQRDCIPQYTVGHHMRMQKALWELSGETWKGLSVAGASYNGVGVNDCIRGARDVAKSLGRGRPVTGLERYADDGVEWVRTVFYGMGDRSAKWPH